MASTAILQQKINFNDIKERTSYDIDKFIEKLYKCKPLNKKELKFLIEKAKEVFLKEDNCQFVPCPVTVCGDIHGQFYDLLELFKIGGKCPETNYLFLGNYIENGYYSLETVSLLLCLKVRYTNRIYLIRGNHETKEVSFYSCFYDECMRKYNGDPEIWKIFTDLFDFLPFTATVENKIFCLHSGLSPSIKLLDEISLIDRFKELKYDDILSDFLWNIPVEEEDCYGFVPFRKGAGYMFGEDVSHKFCQKNGLNMISRGHQCMKNGYEWCHKEKVCTIFSAPNYLYRCGNEAAFMEVNENMDIALYKFNQAPRRGEAQLMKKTFY